jgi:ferric-dicitrate binding protein FerR (iron transport regulator)
VSTTVEGTRWLTIDECDRSEVEVAAGRVKVRDLIDNKTKILTAGKTYVAAR